MNQKSLKDKKLFIFDIEGVLIPSIENPKVYQSANDVIKELREKGKKIAFLSNISRTPWNKVADTLVELGLASDRDEVFTAGRVAVEYVKRKRKEARVFVISEYGLLADFSQEKNITLTSQKPVDFVVIGLKRNINFTEINFALECVLEGAELISCGYTNYYIGEYMGRKGVFIGDIPICEMISFTAGKKGEYIKIGKPSPIIFQYLLSKYQVEPSEAVMIGDKIETDIAGAVALGIYSIFLESEERKSHFTPPIYNEKKEPNLKVKNISEILNLFQ